MSMKCNVAALATSAILAMTISAWAGETVGPDGEKPTPTSALKLTDTEVAKIKEGKYTSALLWHTSSDFVNAVTAGAKDEFARLGVSVVADTDAGFDAAKQKTDVETVMAKKPSAILTLALDPVTAARGVQASGGRRRQDRAVVQQAQGIRSGQGLRDHRHRRSVPDGQTRRRRARRGDSARKARSPGSITTRNIT